MRRLNVFMCTVAVASLAACGGGGSGATSTSSSMTFQAVASEGELVSYTVDTQALTYSYQIIESAYGKTGATGSGQLTRNTDGTYTPSGFNGKVAVLDSGLLLGAIYEDLNNDGTREIIPVLGVSNPISTLEEVAGIYNFVSRECRNFCTNYYGTVKVNADGTWSSCRGGNLASSNYNCQASATGSISAFSSGRAALIANGYAGPVVAGSILGFKDLSNGQKATLIDLNGNTGLGKGAIFAASQTLPSNADGNWTYLHTNGTSGDVSVSGTGFTDSGRLSNGTTYGPTAGSFTRNVPWNGFITTGSGAIIMPTGSGLYAGYFGAYSSMSIGVKK